MTLPEAIEVWRHHLKHALTNARMGDDNANSALDYLLDFDPGHVDPEDDPVLYKALKILKDETDLIEGAKRERMQRDFHEQVRGQKRGSRR